MAVVWGIYILELASGRLSIIASYKPRVNVEFSILANLLCQGEK